MGTDILRISRMERKLDNGAFLNGVFTEYEREYIKKSERSAAARAAGIFCAKEACVKAAGTGFCGIMPKDISITHDRGGAPRAQIIGKGELSDLLISVSISHDGDYAAAFAVAVEP